MTEFEHWNKKIIEINAARRAVAVKNGIPVVCKLDCPECDLNEEGIRCAVAFVDWLCSEHIEKPKLTKKEHALCEILEKGWVVRDGDSGCLWWHKEKPEREGDICWVSDGTHKKLGNITFFAPLSFIECDDAEPWSIEDLLKLEVAK